MPIVAAMASTATYSLCESTGNLSGVCVTYPMSAVTVLNTIRLVRRLRWIAASLLMLACDTTLSPAMVETATDHGGASAGGADAAHEESGDTGHDATGEDTAAGPSDATGHLDDGESATDGSADNSTADDVAETGDDDGGASGLAIPSAGCGVSTVGPGGHAGLTIVHGGMTRSYDLFVPPAHDGQTPVPLVVNFHGWTQTPADQAEFSQMNGTATERGFVVAYPAGIETSWNAGLCCGGAQSQGIDDVGFARAVVAQLGTTLCVDERRVYATGHSNGAFLSHRLACEAADVFAAIGSIAGVIGIPAAACTPGRAVPVMHMHGTGDGIVAIGGGGVLGHPSALESTVGWVARNGCDPTSAVTVSQGDTSCQEWSGCQQGATVSMCTIEGMGHCWPGNPTCSIGAPSTTIHASEVLAEFFAAHAMP